MYLIIISICHNNMHSTELNKSERAIGDNLDCLNQCVQTADTN